VALKAIFQITPESPSLLAQLQARLTRLLTSVDKPPYPQDWYSPLAQMEGTFHYPEIHAGASARNQAISVVGSPRFRPSLDRKKLTRQVQAPEWWGNEPVIIVRGKKITRKDIVLATSSGTAGTEAPPPREKNPALADLRVAAAQFPALRQIAFEVLNSPELLKLAGIAS
jgi:hypothetical protein